MNVQDIRCEFAELRAASPDADMLEIVGASFVADEPSIFGTTDYEYAIREIEWYKSHSLSVHDMPGVVPSIWQEVSSEEGLVNSNYGYLFFSHGNCDQFAHVVDELKRDESSRRACAIYTRPTIHYESQFHGMQDFICTNTVQYMVRGSELVAVVQMRSNDAVYGYKNDVVWQRYAQLEVVDALKLSYPLLTPGRIYWQVGSLHVYPRHFHLVDEWVVSNAQV